MTELGKRGFKSGLSDPKEDTIGGPGVVSVCTLLLEPHLLCAIKGSLCSCLNITVPAS